SAFAAWRPGDVTMISSCAQSSRFADAACCRATRRAAARRSCGMSPQRSIDSPRPRCTRSRCTISRPLALPSATSSRSVLAPTSMTPTRIGVIVVPPSAGAWSAAAARKAASGSRECISHENGLSRAVPSALARSSALPAAVCIQIPRLAVVRQQNVENTRDVVLRSRIFDRDDDLDAVVEVPRHQIGAAEERRGVIRGLENEQSAVLEEAADDAAHPDGLAQIGNSGPQRADTAREDLDLRALLRGGVQLIDDVWIGERVDLDPDPSVLSVFRDGADLGDQPLAQCERRDEDLAELARAPEAGQVVEEVGDVGADLLVGREQAEVLVASRRSRVVVPGADVDVPLQLVALPANDQRRLRVDLEIRKAVDDMDAGPLEVA